MRPTLLERLREIGAQIAETVAKKDLEYGNSWKKRGGVGAFMMLARKWDRIEEQCRNGKLDATGAWQHQWDVIELALNDSREEGLIDDIEDLMGYLLLVRDEINHRLQLRDEDRRRAAEKQPYPPDPLNQGEEPGPSYVNPDSAREEMRRDALRALENMEIREARVRCNASLNPGDPYCLLTLGHQGEHSDGKFRW